MKGRKSGKEKYAPIWKRRKRDDLAPKKMAIIQRQQTDGVSSHFVPLLLPTAITQPCLLDLCVQTRESVTRVQSGKINQQRLQMRREGKKTNAHLVLFPSLISIDNIKIHFQGWEEEKVGAKRLLSIRDGNERVRDIWLPACLGGPMLP